MKLNLEILVHQFLDLHNTVNNNTVHTKLYDKRDDYDFVIEIYPNLD
jgi:hypothetical protein